MKPIRSVTSLTVAAVWLFGSLAFSRDIHVHPVQGDDARSGEVVEVTAANGPVRTIQRAIKLAGPGDVVHLAKLAMPYRESVVFHNRQGDIGRPIVLDGHGATVTGLEPVDLTQWDQPEPGLYRTSKLLVANDAIVDRWFFRMNGRINRMQRCSKGPSQPLKAVADLKPGEWTYLKAESAFYIRVDPQVPLSDLQIEAPLRSSGVQVSGDCSHLEIRNLNTTHVYNDGFNIHGKCRDVLFQNVSATECGDDGISAHDDCRIRVDGLRSVGNATGFCHTNDSHSDSKNVTIRDCIGFDVFVLNGGQHRLGFASIESSAAQSISVHGDRQKSEFCTLELDHVSLTRHKSATNPYVRFYENSIVTAEHCEFSGFHFVVTGQSLFLRNCTLGGETLGKLNRPELSLGPHVRWFGARNLYDVSQWRLGTTTYSPADFSKYQQAQQQDAGSMVTPLAQHSEQQYLVPIEGDIDIGGIGGRGPSAVDPEETLAPQGTNFVRVRTGHLPLIVSAPHGGHFDVPHVDARVVGDRPTGGAGVVTLRDINTDKLAQQLVEAIERRFWKSPHLVLSRAHRKYVDMNRPAHIAYDDPDAKPLHNRYHTALATACRDVQKQFGTGLLLDLHGQSVARDTVFRGTHDGKTTSLLRERFGIAALHGEQSLFGLLKARGWKVDPETLADPERSNFRGGYIVQTYGSHTAFGIDAMQLEFGGDYTAASARPRTASVLADALADYAQRYIEAGPQRVPERQ